MIDRLTTLLGVMERQGAQLDAENALDALWLSLRIGERMSQFVPQHSTTDAHAQQNSAEHTGGELTNRATESKLMTEAGLAEQGSAERGSAEPKPDKAPLEARRVSTRRTEVLVGSPIPHTRALARCLQPLRRRFPSPVRSVIDEQATVRRAAEEDLWIPVLRPAPERWLDVSLVIDQSVSMEIWTDAAFELRRVLWWSGAFRDVRLWWLETEHPSPVLYSNRRNALRRDRPRSKGEVVAAGNRGLVLVLTDCVSRGWRNGEVAAILHRWSHVAPLAMLQVLPERMWPRTALGEAESVRLRAIEPATRNSHLIEDKPDIWLTMDNLDECAGPSFVAPLVPLERILLERFARMVTGSCADWTPGFRFRVAPVREARESVPQAEMAAEQRVGHFWAVASPTAARLAAMTAVAPLPQLNLGILRLLRGLLPEADLTHEAEVLLGGLLRLSTPQDGLPARATDYQLDFIEGVREQLLNSVRIDDAVETLRHLNRYIAERGIGIRTMHAELADPESHAGHIDGTNPELRQTVEVLQRIGGVHARLVGKPRKVATETPIPRSHAAVEIPVLSAEQASEEPAAGDPMPYEYDVFVSYARVDDQPVDSDSVGWVSALVKKFRNRVEQLTGRRGSVSIFMDVDNLPHDVDASREFTAIAGRSRLLLVVLSPGYIYSQGCQAELQAYLEASSRREDLIQPSAPFVVDLGEVAHEDWPLSLQGMLGYRFWSKDTITGHTRRLGYPIPMSDDREYYKVLDRLAREVSTELVAHRKRETVSSVLSAAESSAASGHVQTADSFQPPALPPLPSNVVYVSYASVDDEPSFAGDSGWVSTLVRLLSKRVAELAGWTDAVSFVMNKTVAGSSPADDGIAYAVKNSTMILVLLSPAYLLSAWARRELERLHGLEGRVFLLDLGNIDLDFLPSELRVRSVFSFWMEEQEGHRRQRRRLPGPDDPKYHGLYSDALNDLALEIFRAIQKDESPERSRSHDPEVHTRAAISVFLADVSDDLYFARDDVARYLSQAGFRVLPESEGLTNSMVEFDEGLHRALAESDFYIQLLSEHRGQRAPGRDETLPAYQYRIAKELGLPMRQWRDPDLRAEDVEDEHQRDLLFGQDVIACPLDEFSAFMVARLANPLGAIPPLSDPLVHVICAKEDSRWTEAVLNALNEAGWGWSYTRTDSSPEEPHGDLAEVIDVCDALLVVYDAGSAEWLRRQLVQIRKLAIHRARPLAAVGVLELRPGLHSPIGMKLPRMIHISLDHSPTLEDLRPFLQAVISRLDADAFSRPRRR